MGGDLSTCSEAAPSRGKVGCDSRKNSARRFALVVRVFTVCQCAFRRSSN